MGTQVHNKGYLPSRYSMRDLSEDSNSSSWPLFYGDKTFINGQYYNGFVSSTKTDVYPGYNKDVLKQKILEHESIFKNQVVELHRLYRIQRDMMHEFKRDELHKLRTSMDPSSPSSLLGSQIPSEDARKWHITSFPSPNSGCARPSKSVTVFVNSPLSFPKGNGGQFDQCQMQNGCSSNICEVSERPSKVRKKLFNLELPADEYTDIDNSEQLRANGGSFDPCYRVNGNYRVAQESRMKLFLGDGAAAKSNYGKSTLTSNTCRSSIELADLNEPAQLEEATPSPVDFRSYGDNHRECRGVNASAKSNPAFVAFPRDSTNGSLNSLDVDSKGKEREWLSSAYVTGNVKGLAPVPQSLEQDKLTTPSNQAQVMFNKAYRPPGIHPLYPTRDDLWKQRAVHSLETFHINHEHPFANSSELANSWSHTVCSWGKPSGNITQSPQVSQSHDIFGDKWQINDSSKLILGLVSDQPMWTRFDHGSSLASKESPVGFLSVANCAKVENMTSERTTTNGFQRFLNSTNKMDSVSEKGFDLNLPFESSVNEGASRCDIELVDGKKELQDPLSGFPWLKAKQAYTSPPFCRTNTLKDASSLEDCNMRAIKENRETQNVRKILGVPIRENSVASNNESSSLVSTSVTLQSSPEGENCRDEQRNMVIDINMPYDLCITEPEKPAAVERVVVEKVMETKAKSIRNCFDLNSCITEDEDPFSIESNNVNVKAVLEIDLEAPVLEAEETNVTEEDKQQEESSRFPEDKPEQRREEVVRIAAEAIVAISSSSQCIRMEKACNDLSNDPFSSLHWFVDVVSSCADELENRPERQTIGKDGTSIACSTAKEIDSFEAMILQLTETKEEDYMPKPFVPEVQNVEDGGATTLTNRTRRRRVGRGRQRRDFQRDILPGLVSLSRHEVTEDIQTFGGLMRATGHPWNSGLTRRSGTRNGRSRRTVIEAITPDTVLSPVNPLLLHQLNNREGSLEDKSLTGWGKTTRRPRRQRCPAGNPPPFPLN